MTSLSSSVKWTNPIGIELTMIPIRGKECKPFGITRYEWFDKFKEEAEKSKIRKSSWSKVYVDPGCVEVPSPILRSWKATERWYHEIQEVNQKAGLTTFRQNHTAGGGHIHFSGMTHVQKLNMMSDVQARPYLSWALLDPSDDINARNLNQSKGSLRFSVMGKEDGLPWQQTIEQCHMYSRGNVLRYRKEIGTLEWRAFDSAADWGIQACQVAFIQRYVQLIKKRCESVRVYPMSIGPSWYHYSFGPDSAEPLYDRWLGNNGLDNSIKDFKEFITETLELPWSEYEWFIERNLVPKYKNGWSLMM